MERLTINLTLNGTEIRREIFPGEILIDFLRSNGCKSVKKGCMEGECGSCTVLLDEKPIPSCQELAARVDGHKVTTVEGLGNPDNPHIIQQAFVDAGAVQCGFCTPGMVLVTKSLLDRNPDPTEAEIKDYLDGNMCRCTGYVKIIDAVKLAAARLKGDK